VNLKAWVKDFTGDLNQPAFKALVFGVLTIGTGQVYWACVFLTITIQEAPFGLWLGFLAAGWGITYWDYRSKRETTMDQAQRAALKQEQASQPIQEREPPPPAERGG
jgi:cbb3-type cytochrome oxidase subunit 3